MAALPAGLRRDLQRQIRKLTPWHVRVTIRSNPRKTTVRIWSLRWVGYGSAMTHPSGAPLAIEIANIVLFVQSFMADEGGLLWPTGDQRRTIDEILIPNVTVGEASVTVAWTREGRTIFELAPLPLKPRS